MKLILIILLLAVSAPFADNVEPLLEILDVPKSLLSDTVIEGHFCYDSLSLQSTDENIRKVVLMYLSENGKVIQYTRIVDFINDSKKREIIVYYPEDLAEKAVELLKTSGFSGKTDQNWFQRLFGFGIKNIEFTKDDLKVDYTVKIYKWIYRDCTRKLVKEKFRGFRITVD